MKYLGLNDDGIYYAAKREAEFLACYEKNWVDILEDTYYSSEQIDVGHKFRPRLVYWGFLINGHAQLEKYDFECISKVAVCIELVHKASLLLDDFIDKDTARHGKPTFHTIYGVERTVIFSLNILSRALRVLNQTFSEYAKSQYFLWRCMNELTMTLEDMTLGVLKELDLSSKSFQNICEIREIMHLETSSLITNSILMGAYMAKIDAKEIITSLEDIGNKFGFIFQALNDLEPFCSMKNGDHKGSVNTDFTRNRKNICITILNSIMSNKDKKQILRKEEIDDSKLIDMFQKYAIFDIIMEELDNTYQSMKKDILNLEKYLPDCSKNWSQEFEKFVDSVVSICKNRLI